MSKAEMENLSDTVLWIKFKKQDIRIEQDEKLLGNGKISLCIYMPVTARWKPSTRIDELR